MGYMLRQNLSTYISKLHQGGTELKNKILSIMTAIAVAASLSVYRVKCTGQDMDINM